MSSTGGFDDPRPDGRSARAERRRKERKAQILAASQELFAARGVHAVTTNDLIEAAHISRGTFYQYFDSKEAVLHALLDGFVSRLMAAVEVVDPNGENPEGRTLQSIRRVLDLLITNRALSVVLLREAVGVDAKTDETLARLHAFWHEMVAGALHNGAAAGIIRPVNERIVATAIIGSLKEVLYQYLVVGAFDDQNQDAIAMSIVDVLLKGLWPR